ncbi:hypothetical protein HID58_058116 [Brassica napus]|uniref:Uncharacterized protein n=1 Tax=Brassica napus TaxID=3708 RepID=A0ABQ7ZP32_BRANA|nr:hypothetical protein HID58_058116 [Brassica napus]
MRASSTLAESVRSFKLETSDSVRPRASSSSAKSKVQYASIVQLGMSKEGLARGISLAGLGLRSVIPQCRGPHGNRPVRNGLCVGWTEEDRVGIREKQRILAIMGSITLPITRLPLLNLTSSSFSLPPPLSNPRRRSNF